MKMVLLQIDLALTISTLSLMTHFLFRSNNHYVLLLCRSLSFIFYCQTKIPIEPIPQKRLLRDNKIQCSIQLPLPSAYQALNRTVQKNKKFPKCHLKINWIHKAQGVDCQIGATTPQWSQVASNCQDAGYNLVITVPIYSTLIHS